MNRMDAEDEALRIMEQLARVDPSFSPEAREAVLQMVRAWRSVLAFGRVAKWLIFILAALAGALTAWAQVKAEVAKWFSG